MTTNNTGNPVGQNGSADPRDLFDNAQVLDLLVNSDKESVTGRTGKLILSWDGMRSIISPLGKTYTQEQADAAIMSGEIPDGAYFFIWSDDKNVIAKQYENKSGTIL